MQRILCIGSTSKDIFFPTGEGVVLDTPEDLQSQRKIAFELGGKFHCRDRAEAVGGVAANVAQGLARMGHAAAVYSKIGTDDVGHWILGVLQSAGVQTELLDQDSHVHTDLSAIIVAEQVGDRIIFHNRDANEQLRVEASKVQGYEWLYVSALNGAWRENLNVIVQAAETSGVKIAFNPGQHNLKEDPGLLLKILPSVSVLLLNKDEALELLLAGGIESRAERLSDEQYLIQTLHDLGPMVIAMTDGKRGAWVYNGQEMWHGEIYEPNGLIDTTGAGDAFGSGFFSGYLSQYALERCLRYGIANAGSVVGFYGASEGLLDQTKAGAYSSEVQATRVVI